MARVFDSGCKSCVFVCITLLFTVQGPYGQGHHQVLYIYLCLTYIPSHCNVTNKLLLCVYNHKIVTQFILIGAIYQSF